MSRSQNHRSSRGSRDRTVAPIEQTFTCVHCHVPVCCAPLVAGVQNRNHCPACLWSRHLDWREPGDRRSNCRAPMEPVGLTIRRWRDKYGRERDGELMIVHRCTGCGTLVINRIAADDDEQAIIELFERSQALRPAIAPALAARGVSLLTGEERELVLRALYGAAMRPAAPHTPL